MEETNTCIKNHLGTLYQERMQTLTRPLMTATLNAWPGCTGITGYFSFTTAESDHFILANHKFESPLNKDVFTGLFIGLLNSSANSRY